MNRVFMACIFVLCLMSDTKDAKYECIWKSIYPCVEKCLLSNFRDVQEMLHCNRWCIVHTVCRKIISRHMVLLCIDDPHDFDKAVCWNVVKKGLDRDPKWRCICAFFLAAAMELDLVKRINESKYKNVKNVVNYVKSVENVGEIDKNTYSEYLEIVKHIEKMYKETNQKVAEIHQRVHDMHTQKVNNPGITEKKPMTHIARSSVHIIHHSNPDSNSESPLGVHDLLHTVLKIMQQKSLSNHSISNTETFKEDSSQNARATAPLFYDL